MSIYYVLHICQLSKNLSKLGIISHNVVVFMKKALTLLDFFQEMKLYAVTHSFAS